MVTLQALKRLGHAAGRHARRDPGLRQRRRHGGAADGARRASRSSAIIEYDGAVYNPNGLDIEALQEHRKETGSITGFRRRRGHGQRRGDVPGLRRAAAGRHGKRDHSGTPTGCAARSCAKARTAPPLPLADAILAEKKIFVIPDILANAGGVTVSYFEWVQDRQGFFWNEKLVNERLAGDHGEQLRRRGGVRGEARA